jgi:hypothetical protein
VGLLVPIAWVLEQLLSTRTFSPLVTFGRSSLFVYWIHVEMVYGFLTWPIHRRLTFEQAIVAFAVFTVFLYGLVKLKDRIHRRAPNIQLISPK